jgi:hypothetical protein
MSKRMKERKMHKEGKKYTRNFVISTLHHEVNVSLSLTKYHAMKLYEGVEALLNSRPVLMITLWRIK